MARNHVSGDQLPLQGQNLYADPNYDNLFSNVDQYGTPTWNSSQINHHHSNVVPQNLQTSAAPSWQHNSFAQQPYSAVSSQPYASSNNGFSTASPYPYTQFASHGHVPTYTHSPAPAVDPSLVDHHMAMRQQQQSPYQMQMRNPTPQTQTQTQTPTQTQPQPQAQNQTQTSTVAPLALQQNTTPAPAALKPTSHFQIPKSTTEMFAQRTVPPSVAVQPVSNPKYEVPKGKASRGFSMIDATALAKANKIAPLNKLVHIGLEPLNLASNRTALPQYNARQSMNDLKKAGAGNRKFLHKVSNKSSSKSSPARVATAGKLAAGSPSALRRAASDSDSYTDSSDDDSDYSDEEDEPSPLPASRPDEPHEAVRYDVIKATWSPRRSSLGSEKIKTGLREIWEILNTIQKRWSADRKAQIDAEEQKNTHEIPVLKSRVNSQRELLRSALKAALEFAHPDVLYHMGANVPFIYMCYQFLANRFKAQEFNSDLVSAIYEILVRCVGTLTTETLEKTKLNRALNSLRKGANESNKALIQQIFDGAAATSKKSKAKSPPQDDTGEGKDAKRSTPQPAARPPETAAAKKSKASEPAAILAKKATTAPAPASKATGAALSLAQKRPGDKVAAPSKARGNQVVNKPSSLFSTLNAANKKPAPAASSASKPAPQQKTNPAAGREKKPAPAAPARPTYSFADAMADIMKPKEPEVAPPKPEKQLPPETPEEKAKRLRKEARRHLRVTFKPDQSLVQVRVFHHDPEEELGHDASLVRDAGDIGGEGRMFKQHRDMDIEEDDEEMEVSYRSWLELSAVDFSVVDMEDRRRNYQPLGGGLMNPICPEKEANQNRENSTLMVFYTHPSDIPPSPREPLEPSVQEPTAPPKEFGTPPEWVLQRSPSYSAAAPKQDFSALENLFKQHSSQGQVQPSSSQAYTPNPTPENATPDLSAILSALQQPNPAAQQPTFTPQPAATTQPAQAFDWTSFLAATLGQNGNGAFPAAATAWPAVQNYQQPQQQQTANQGYEQQQQQQQQQQNQYANGGSKRQREEINSNDRGHASFKKHKGGRGHHRGDVPHKVIPCKFYQAGKCTKGDDCTFIHDRN